MGFLDKLKPTPRWKHADPAVRLEAVRELEDPAEFAAAWRGLAGNWSFAQVNELIERHNRNFPAESRLAMDPRTRDFVRLNGRSYLREPLSPDWILSRFTPDRAAAPRG